MPKTEVKKKKAKKTAPKKPSSSKKLSAKKAAVKPAKKAGKAKEENTQKLRIRVRAYEHKVLDASVKQIIDTALRYDAKIQGPTPLPTEKKKYTVNRAPFVFEDSREQFEMRVHKRLIDIIDPPAKVVEALSNINLPSGVNIDVKMIAS